MGRHTMVVVLETAKIHLVSPYEVNLVLSVFNSVIISLI